MSHPPADAVRAVARGVPLLLLGPKGSGRRHLAKLLHAAGPQRDRAFRDVDDWEALRVDPDLRSTGTLFIPELAAIDLTGRRTLRMLLRRDAEMGGPKTQLICASTLAEDALLSALDPDRDLYYLVAVALARVHPLAARLSEIPEIAATIIREIAAYDRLPHRTLSPDELAALHAAAWPGHVAQLRMVLHRWLASTEDVSLQSFLQPAARKTGRWPSALDAVVELAEIEREYILHVLALANGNKQAAAAKLGVDRRTLYRKLDEWAAEAAEREV